MKIIATTGVVGERGRSSAITLVIVALAAVVIAGLLLTRYFHTPAVPVKPAEAAKPASDCDTPPAAAPAPAPAAPASASGSSKAKPDFLTFAACSDGSKAAPKAAVPKR